VCVYIGRRLQDGRVLLLAGARVGIAVVPRPADARRVEVRAGPDTPVSLPLRDPSAHTRRPHPAPPAADVNPRLA